MSWTTNEPADSQLRYATTANLSWAAYPTSSRLIASTKVTSHSFTLEDLKSNTTYYFTVGSKDAAGNGPSTKEGSFQTKLSHWAGDSVWDFKLEGKTRGWTIRNNAAPPHDGIYSADVGYWQIDPEPSNDPLSGNKVGVVSPLGLTSVDTTTFKELEVKLSHQDSWLSSLKAMVMINGAWQSPFDLNYVLNSGAQEPNRVCVYKGKIPQAGKIDQVRIDIAPGVTGNKDIISIDYIKFLTAAGPNRPPENLVVAGLVDTAYSGVPISLSASAMDPDGDTISYSYSAPEGKFSAPTAAATTWTPPQVGSLIPFPITIVAQDGNGGRVEKSHTFMVYPPQSGDTTGPTLTITNPATDNAIFTTPAAISMAWTASDASGIQYYNYRHYDCVSQSVLLEKPYTATTEVAMTFTTPQCLKLEVEAYDTKGNRTTRVRQITVAAPSAPGASAPARPVFDPVPTSYEFNGPGSYAISWSKVEGAEYYLLQESSNGILNEERLAGVNNRVKSYLRSEGGTWYYKVKAGNSHGESDWAGPFGVTVTVAPNILPEVPYLYQPADGVTGLPLRNIPMRWSSYDKDDSYGLIF